MLFVHDTKLKEDVNGTYYTDGSYNENVWNRYLSICSELTIIARKEPYIYSVKDAKDKFNYFNKEKIKFKETPNLNSSIKKYLFDFKERNKMRRTIKDAVLETDFLIVRLPSTNGNIAVHYAKKNKIPYLVEVVGCSWNSLWYYNIKGKILAPFSYYKQKNIIASSTHCIYVTSNYLQNRYPTKGNSINCSDVFIENFDNSVLTKRIEKIKSIDLKDKLVIGTTAAVNVKYKGQESIIKALGKLKEKGINNFEYQLVGDGDPSYLIRMAEKFNILDQVNFIGVMSHDEVFTWLDKIDIYVQPSKTEGLPRGLIEAMSRGLLVMGSDVGGIPELVEVNYLFNKSKNEKEICNILMKINKNTLLEEAKRNFSIAKEYDNSLIESRRHLFLRKFSSQS